jgi:hypothetical protein
MESSCPRLTRASAARAPEIARERDHWGRASGGLAKRERGVMPERPVPFANTPEFYTALGCFYAAWSRTDLAIDCAVWKALKAVTPEQVHERVAAMKFGRKCEYFRSLLPASKFENIEKVKCLLNRITDHSMRNVFAHSFLASDEKSVMFIHRTSHRGQYQANGYEISRERFFKHVGEFVQLSFDFERALGLSDKEVRDFAAAALPVVPIPDESSPAR